MLAHSISFVSYSVICLPNCFISFIHDKTFVLFTAWTMYEKEVVKTTSAYVNQMIL